MRSVLPHQETLLQEIEKDSNRFMRGEMDRKWFTTLYGAINPFDFATGDPGGPVRLHQKRLTTIIKRKGA